MAVGQPCERCDSDPCKFYARKTELELAVVKSKGNASTRRRYLLDNYKLKVLADRRVGGERGLVGHVRTPDCVWEGIVQIVRLYMQHAGR